MKRTIIILIALVLFISLPVFASTPEEENAPVPTSEDGLFLDMTQLTEDQMIDIYGNAFSLMSDGASNVTITGGSGIKSGSKNESTTTSSGVSGGTNGLTGTASEGKTNGTSTDYIFGYSWTADPNTGIITYTYTYTNDDGTVYTVTWQVDTNAGNYPSATTTSNTTQSGWSDVGASRPK
ncbi:MAG: hypothetical protein NUV32_03595 [Exilispira sp.]|jgi:hypothetical protein|nr:hypothetical protein [Exilispira sp.]